MRLIATLWLCAAACLAADAQPRVVTSFLPIYCWAASVAGDKAAVENLLSSHAEPHEYAFTPGDARKLAGSSLVILNGMGLEPWFTKWRRGVAQTDRGILTISSLLNSEQRIDSNPHFWLDPQLACVGVSNITAALMRLDAANAAAYASNGVAYMARLERLDAEIRTSLDSITNRAIVTYHDAFPYFARRYGLEVVGVVEQVPEVNPTPKYLAALSRTIRERGVRAIFVPPHSASRLARQIAKDLRVQLVELDTIEAGECTPDAYEHAMRANLDALRKTLR